MLFWDLCFGTSFGTIFFPFPSQNHTSNLIVPQSPVFGIPNHDFYRSHSLSKFKGNSDYF